MTLKERYKKADPIGIYTLCNFGGLVILDMDGEKATAAYDFGEGYKQIRRHTIFYTYTGGICMPASGSAMLSARPMRAL